MNHGRNRVSRLAVLALLAVTTAMGAEARGQNSSLFATQGQEPALTLAKSSWTYTPPPEMKQFRVNDLITIVVSEQSVVISEGEMDRKKKANGDLVLKDWILLKSLTRLIPDPQSSGDPRISGSVDNKMRSEANLETRDSMKFKITCHIADIRPNGNLIIEGRHTIRNNEESWECALTGEVRPDAILPNGTVLSENVADLRIDKRESGHVRDGYRRGWMLRWLDRHQPF